MPLISKTGTALTATSDTAKYIRRRSPGSALASSGGEDKYAFSSLKALIHFEFH